MYCLYLTTILTIFRSNQYPSSGLGVIHYNTFFLERGRKLIAAQVVGVVVMKNNRPL